MLNTPVSRITKTNEERTTKNNEIRKTKAVFLNKNIVVEPVLFESNISQKHFLTSENIIVEPINEKASVTQNHSLTSKDILNQSVTLGSSSFFEFRTFLVQVFESEENLKQKGTEYHMKKSSDFGTEGLNYSDYPNNGSRESYFHNFYDYTTLLENFGESLIFTLPDFSSDLKTKKMVNYISGFYSDTFRKIFDPEEPTSIYSQIKNVFENLYPTPTETWQPKKWWGDEEIKIQISNLLSNGDLFNKNRFDNFGIGFDERHLEVYNNLPKNVLFGSDGFRFDSQGFPIFDRELMFPIVTKSLVNFVKDTGFQGTEQKDVMEIFFDFEFETFKDIIKFMESEFILFEDTKQYDIIETKENEFERPNTFFNKAKQNLHARGMNYLDEEQIVNTENLENPDVLSETAKIRNSGVFLGGTTQKEFFQEYLDIGFYRYVTEIFKRFMLDRYFDIKEFVFDPIFNYYDEYFKIQQELIIDQFDIMFSEQLKNIEEEKTINTIDSQMFDSSIENDYFTKGALELPMQKNFYILEETDEYEIRHTSKFYYSIGKNKYFRDFIDIGKKSF